MPSSNSISMPFMYSESNARTRSCAAGPMNSRIAAFIMASAAQTLRKPHRLAEHSVHSKILIKGCS